VSKLRFACKFIGLSYLTLFVYVYLEDTNGIRRRSNPIDNIERSRSKQERISFVLLTELCQLFTIEHLTDWKSPQSQQIVMLQLVRGTANHTKWKLPLGGIASHAGLSPPTAEK